MKTLRLFIDNKLDQPINWQLLDGDDLIEEGSSNFNEIHNFENAQIEAYLNASCSSIFKINIRGINTKKLNDEMILGILEDNLVDDIEELKPILIQVEDDLAYVAIFDLNFYEQLILALTNLDKPIKLLQSFAYSTFIDEENNCWTLYLSEEQNFLRTSKFEYFLLDDNRPLPLILEDMLQNSEEKPNSILVYADKEYNLEDLTLKYSIEYKYANQPLIFGIPVWNFYNQKSSAFSFKIDTYTKQNIFKLIKVVKYFFLILAIFWLISIINLFINKYRLESELKTNLSKIGEIDNISPQTLNKLNSELTRVIHERGLRAEEDFSTMFKRFLKVVSTVQNEEITGLEYDKTNATLNVFVRNFDTSQFKNYKDILRTQRISASITDYKSYVKTAKNKQLMLEGDGGNTIRDQPISDDTQWVITLKSAWIFETLE